MGAFAVKLLRSGVAPAPVASRVAEGNLAPPPSRNKTGWTIATANEHFCLLKPWREATDNRIRPRPLAGEETIKRMFEEVKAEMPAGRAGRTR